MTNHKFIFNNSLLTEIDEEIDLILTSPPYPMIEMWDACFCEQNPDIKKYLEYNLGGAAWISMIELLNKTISKCTEKLKIGGFLIINIGDATRTINGNFSLYATHSEIDRFCIHKLGLSRLPSIIWNKPSNKPNKYMGSGMLPAGAYITLEHEYILIYRKGNKREFEDKTKRRESAFFWEERNKWFSDIWTIRGVNQKLNLVRSRSGAFPHELAYRLIAMYSCYDDLILDPFAGTGTTSLASMNLNRNSISIESQKPLIDQSLNRLLSSKDYCNEYTKTRITKHLEFLKQSDKITKYKNKHYGFPVMTKQEESIIFKQIIDLSLNDNVISCNSIDMNI